MENLRNWTDARADEGVIPITQATVRERCKVGGVIQNIRIDPREGSGSIEATFIDGYGQMHAKWVGRNSLKGIRLGMGIIVTGVIGTGTDNDLMILNPEYDLIPSPEHG